MPIIVTLLPFQSRETRDKAERKRKSPPHFGGKSGASPKKLLRIHSKPNRQSSKEKHPIRVQTDGQETANALLLNKSFANYEYEEDTDASAEFPVSRMVCCWLLLLLFLGLGNSVNWFLV